jgi:hypothetical protein
MMVICPIKRTNVKRLNVLNVLPFFEKIQ